MPNTRLAVLLGRQVLCGWFEKAVRAKKEKIANDALARLKKGDSFEKVAKNLSEDGMSDPKGGTLECIRQTSWTRKCRRSWARWSPASSAR